MINNPVEENANLPSLSSSYELLQPATTHTSPCVGCNALENQVHYFTADKTCMINNPVEENASPSSPKIDTIEYLESAISYTASDNAKIHVNIIPFIVIKIGTVDQRNYILMKKVPLESSGLATVPSSPHLN